MRNTKLKTHLLIHIFLYVVIFMTIVMGIVALFVRNSLTNMAFDKTDDTLRILELQLNHAMDHPTNELDLYATMFSEEKENFESNIATILKDESYIERLDILSEDGIIEATIPSNASAVGFDMSSSNVYKKIHTSENYRVYGEMTVDPFLEHSTMFIARKIEDKYMIGYLNLEAFQSILQKITVNDGYITVSDENGTYIGHSNNDLVEQRSVDTNVAKIIEGDLLSRSKVNYLGDVCILQYRKLQDYNWYIMYYQFNDTIVKPVTRTVMTMAFFSILSIPIIMFFILRIVRRVDTSLEHLVLTTGDIAEGHYKVAHGDFHYEEFNRVFQSVSEMSIQVEEREEEISALNDELETNYYTMAVLLAKAIEAKDHYTGNHCERVRDFAMILGQGYNLSKIELRELKFGATLHDIGKIGIPEMILNKMGKLTDEEFEIIKGHSQGGYEIIKGMPTMHLAKLTILHHHENYDGTGYPHGLAGHEIPLLARIVSIADAFDAMISERPYRNQVMSRNQAFEELKQNAGIQFDPELVELFIELIRDTPIEGSIKI
ncbi:HD domain-containing phosphohydrolase [Fusibacter ferrireducens]|uniref:HD domain-containing protein n=1 Tax=Fusibacter ferrireducens TaxID=2785058 RepID=A0ABR9ZUS4_9FIRM|nr:HD domain-containing phosphohydrolase [Fusibacter ferrireducens]MBF4694101.1 HD domain-containing protein [Fusibacter ferrireducens]